MDKELVRAIEVLESGDYSLVIVKDDEVFTYDERGVKALLRIFNDDYGWLKGAYIADKVIGKAVSMLAVEAGVKQAYGKLVSQLAIDYFEANGLGVFYGTKTEKIMNMKQDGLCPIENISMGLDDVEELVGELNKFYGRLKLDSKKE